MPVRRYAKTIVAIVAAVAVVVNAAISDGNISGSEWLQIAFAALGAVGVYAIPNRPPIGEPKRADISEQGDTSIILIVAVIAIVVIVAIAAGLIHG
jgi:hypothetical protein